MAREHPGPEAPVPSNDARRLLTLLQQLSLAVNRAETTDAAFAHVLAQICRFMGWPLAHVYIWSEAADILVSSRIWYHADIPGMAQYRESTEAAHFQRGQGIVGRIWENAEAMTLLDLTGATNPVRPMPQREMGIHAYFAFPVMFDGLVMAVIEFFACESAALGPDMVAVINHACTLMGVAMHRQEALARLHQSQAQLAEVQRTAHVGHWEWDVLQNKITWSPELYRIFGLSPDSFVDTYEAFLSRIHPDDLAHVEDKVGDAYQNGRPFDYFHRIIRPDGSERVLHARGRPIHDNAGKIVKLYGTVQDSTEQKEAELKLANTVRRLSALMDIGQAIAATLDVERIYELVLTRARSLLGADFLVLFLYRQQDEMLEVIVLDRNGVVDMHGTRVSLDSSVAGGVWESRQSLHLTGDECAQRLSPVMKQLAGYQPEAMLAAPIHWHDQALGVLEAAHRDASAFVDEDLRLLETVAAWMAIAVGNARQYLRLQRRLSERDAITAINNAITETLELEKVLHLIARHVQDIIPSADWTAIHLREPETDQIELAVQTGSEDYADDDLTRHTEGVANHVMAGKGVINVADRRADPVFASLDPSAPARSLLVVAVESRLARIGAISVWSSKPSVFTADDERLLSILGVQAGMAIENARLYAAQRQARRTAEKQRERMRHLARRVVEAQEAERARIGRELHDESGQALTSLKIGLDLMRARLPDDRVDLRESLQEMLELADRTMVNLRLLSHNLRPAGLDAFGLNAALAGLCYDFETHTPLQVTYMGIEVPELAASSALSLYRFAQEALTNIVKHAAATEVTVTMRQDSGMIRLHVADNGRGFVPPDLEETVPVRGTGLLGMMERLEMVDGHFAIESAPGKGSCLTATVPFNGEGA